MTELLLPASTIRLTIRSSLDIFAFRQKARALAKELDFSLGEATLIAAIISELGRNILTYARSGELTIEPLQRGPRIGVTLTAAFGDESTVSTPNIPFRLDAATDWFLLARLRGSNLLEETGFHSQPASGVTFTGIKWRSSASCPPPVFIQGPLDLIRS